MYNLLSYLKYNKSLLSLSEILVFVFALLVVFYCHDIHDYSLIVYNSLIVLLGTFGTLNTMTSIILTDLLQKINEQALTMPNKKEKTMIRLYYYFVYLITTPSSKQAPVGLHYNLNTGKVIALVFIFLFVISLYLLRSPIMILLAMSMLTFIPILNSIPSKWCVASSSDILLEAIVHFFSVTGVLKILYYFYIFWHQCLTLKGFKFFYTLLHVILLLYLIVIRYIFYLRIENLPIPFSLYFLYGFLFLFLILKTITDSSFFFISLICNKYTKYKEILIAEMPEELPDLPKTPSGNDYNKPKWSFVSLHYHRHRHINPPEMPQSRHVYYAKLSFAILGLGFTAFAGYNYHRSAEAAIKAADAAVKSADAAVRSADIAEVQAGLMTREEFNKKHKE